MRVEVDPDDVKKLKTDDRGRAYLGSEYADSEVEVAVLAVTDTDEDPVDSVDGGQ